MDGPGSGFYPCFMRDSRSSNEDDAHPAGVLPSAFMRQLRPEIYSDTEGRADYQLDAPLLEYHLETLTQRNQSHDFEIFCRKLCEKAICPNLRPQTGPDGGGDSKADTETFPVADEISDLSYLGEPNAGRERWAFAFSAKQTWQQKIRDDVQGLIDTGRAYDRIICVTSRFAKSKALAKLEQEMSELAGVPVTIFDRTWIVSQVIDHGRKDIAFHYLGVGSEITDPTKLGPTDYSRLRQLDEIEQGLADLDAQERLDPQALVDALVAAKLSRGLEKPRVETDGRFARAIRLADKHGSLHQRIEARYEEIWTAFWWHDDFAFLNDKYAEVEALAAEAGHTLTLSFLVNLGQLLFNSVLHGHLDRDACQLDRRIDQTVALLLPMAGENERPNNQLEAEAALCHIGMNRALMAADDEALSRVWARYSAILDRAEGLGEFNAKGVAKLIEAAGEGAGSAPAYEALIDKLADFIATRTGEAQGALILLRRAEKLDLTRHFEMIRLLSKAAMQLTKKEHSADLVDAASLLTIAYRSAGLLWAARATCIFTLATMIIEAEGGDHLPPRFAVVAKIWATLSLDLHHIPDFVVAIRLLRGAIEALPYDESDRVKFRRDAHDLEIIASSRLLNLPDAELHKLSGWPDIFDQAQLFMPRTALLYALGYEGLLREDESLPPTETDEGVKEMFSMIFSQPAGAAGALTAPILNGTGDHQLFSTKLLGMLIQVRAPGTDHGVLAAEAVVGSLEAFFATTLEHRVMPHTERFLIEIVEDGSIEQPAFSVNLDSMTGTLAWPKALPPASFADQALIRDLWVDVAAKVLTATCIVADPERTITALAESERVRGRMALVATAPNSYHRMTGRYLTRAADLHAGEARSYPAGPRPVIARLDLPKAAAKAGREAGREPSAESHRDIGVRSVLDIHLWDQANWRGAGFAGNEPGFPPFLALLFANEAAAARIFERWRERIGPYDEQDRIRVSVIRRLPDHDPAHYAIQISANALPGDLEDGQMVSFTTRSLVTHPTSDENLERFLGEYRRYGAYYLVPAIFPEGAAEPRFLSHLPVLKRQMNVFDAQGLSDNQIEWIAVQQAKETGEA